MIALWLLLSTADAGLIRDWWVPADGRCLVNPDAAEARHAADDDLQACRIAGTTYSETGLASIDWNVVSICMTDHGWVERSRRKWDAWNARCAADGARDAQDFAVLTEELARALAITPPPPPPPDPLTVPPGMLGRGAAEGP